MQYSEVTRIHSRANMPMARFLAIHPLLRREAGEEEGIDWLAGEFLAEVDDDETWEAWLLRQVGAILETRLLADTMAGTSHIARKVCNVEFDAADWAYLTETLGRHPRVIETWNAMVLPQERIAA